MLKFKGTMVIVFIMVALLAYVFLVEIKNPTSEEREEQEKVVLEIENTDDIKSLTFKTPEEEFVCEKLEEGWFITDPVKARGDEGIFNGLLASLSEIKAEEKLEESKEGPEAFGLDKPLSELTITFNDGRAETITVGSKTFDDASYYAYIGKDRKLVTIASYIADSYLLKTVADLRDKTFISFETDKVKEFDFVKDKETVKCQKNEDGGWNILSPFEDRGDLSLINNWLNFVKSLRVQDFLNNMEEADLSLYGLEEPFINISIITDEDGAKKSLIIGSKREAGDGYYAKRADNPEICILPVTAVENLYKDPPETWIDKSVFPQPFGEITSFEIKKGDKLLAGSRDDEGGWLLSSPEEKPAVPWQLENQLRNVLTLKAEETVEEGPRDYGLSAPQMTVIINGKDDRKAVLLVGEDQVGTGDFYAKKEDGKEIFLMNKTVFESLSETVDNPPYEED